MGNNENNVENVYLIRFQVKKKSFKKLKKKEIDKIKIKKKKRDRGRKKK